MVLEYAYSTAAWLSLRRKSTKSFVTPRQLATDVASITCHRAVKKRQEICRRLYNDTDTLLMGDIKVRHLMTHIPVTVGRNETVECACEIIEEQGVDYLLVCDANGKLLGLVSHHYLLRSNAKRVADAMLPNPLFVTPDAMLSATITQMLNEGVSCVAVVEQGRAIGIVTTTDIQLTFQAVLQSLARAKSEGWFIER